jgi:hypothetical protein
MSEHVDDDCADDDEERLTLSLEEALAWVATRNTAFVQLMSASIHSDSFDDANLDRIAMEAGVEMAFAVSATKAWEGLRSSIVAGHFNRGAG